MRQVQISVEVFEGDNTDSLEEVEFILGGEAGTADLHRVFMSIAHFLGYDIESMENIACDVCDICQACEIKSGDADLRREIEILRDEKEALEKKLDDWNMCCVGAKKEECPVTRAKVAPAESNLPKPDWYTPPGD